MINRRTLKCVSCGTRITTRTGIGHANVQKHKFPCPNCKVEIGYALDLDQEKPSLSYREPTNATWDDGDDSEHMILFYPELMVPKDLQNLVSPFVATVHNLKDIEIFQREEAVRRYSKTKLWPVLERAYVHFENANLDLLESDCRLLAAEIPDLTDQEQRGSWILSLSRHFFDRFVAHPNRSARIEKVVARAVRRDENELRALAVEYVESGRMLALWKELKSVRRQFMELYESLQPLLMVRRYWKAHIQDIAGYALSVKNFEDLKSLYIDSVETAFRLLVIGLAVELIATTGKPIITTKGGDKSIWWFEQAANGIKDTQLNKHTVFDYITPALDLGLRNGVGHHSAHYDANSDEIMYVKPDEATLHEIHLSYTAFVEKVFAAYCAFELATVFFQWFFVAGGGVFHR